MGRARTTICPACGQAEKAPGQGYCLTCLRAKRSGGLPATPRQTKAERGDWKDDEIARLKRELAEANRVKVVPAPVRAAVTPPAAPEPATRELSYGRDSYVKASPKKGLHGQVIDHGEHSTALDRRPLVQVDPMEPLCTEHHRPFCRLTGCWQELRDIRLARMKG